MWSDCLQTCSGEQGRKRASNSITAWNGLKIEVRNCSETGQIELSMKL